MWKPWLEKWARGGEDGDVVDVKSFARRLAIEFVSWDASQEPGRVWVGIDDDHLFGDHGIDVSTAKKKVRSVEQG